MRVRRECSLGYIYQWFGIYWEVDPEDEDEKSRGFRHHPKKNSTQVFVGMIFW
jgi:hypothetical protein